MITRISTPIKDAYFVKAISLLAIVNIPATSTGTFTTSFEHGLNLFPTTRVAYAFGVDDDTRIRAPFSNDGIDYAYQNSYYYVTRTHIHFFYWLRSGFGSDVDNEVAFHALLFAI